MFAFFIPFVTILTTFAATAPYAKIKDPKTVQTTVPCKILEGQLNLKATTVAYEPTYDVDGQLTSHKTFEEKTANSTFKDGDLPAGFLAHDTILKMECKDGYYIDNDTYMSQGYYNAKCNNGYLYTCYLDNNHIDTTLQKFYLKYQGNSTHKKCLEATKANLIACRPLCDVTRLKNDTKYTINSSVKIYEVKDFTGFDTELNEVYVTYYYTIPQDSIAISCAGNTFLSHSTPGNEYKDFTVKCDKNGYIEYPNNGTEDIEGKISFTCVDAYSCMVPQDTSDKSWGVYKKGIFERVNKIAHDSYVYVRCENNTNDERSAMCVNGQMLPAGELVCNDNS